MYSLILLFLTFTILKIQMEGGGGGKSASEVSEDLNKVKE